MATLDVRAPPWSLTATASKRFIIAACGDGVLRFVLLRASMPSPSVQLVGELRLGAHAIKRVVAVNTFVLTSSFDGSVKILALCEGQHVTTYQLPSPADNVSIEADVETSNAVAVCLHRSICIADGDDDDGGEGSTTTTTTSSWPLYRAPPPPTPPQPRVPNPSPRCEDDDDVLLQSRIVMLAPVVDDVHAPSPLVVMLHNSETADTHNTTPTTTNFDEEEEHERIIISDAENNVRAGEIESAMMRGELLILRALVIQHSATKTTSTTTTTTTSSCCASYCAVVGDTCGHAPDAVAAASALSSADWVRPWEGGGGGGDPNNSNNNRLRVAELPSLGHPAAALVLRTFHQSPPRNFVLSRIQLVDSTNLTSMFHARLEALGLARQNHAIDGVNKTATANPDWMSGLTVLKRNFQNRPPNNNKTAANVVLCWHGCSANGAVVVLTTHAVINTCAHVQHNTTQHTGVALHGRPARSAKD